MFDYSEKIKNNLYCFPGFMEHPERVLAINRDLNTLKRDFPVLVRNFCTQTNPDCAYDFLFEIWICKMLLNLSVKNLFYEPPNISNKPPDFRCMLEGVQFDIQVKRLHNVANEITKRTFQRECRKRLKKHTKSWFINLKISDALKPQHINDFFKYLEQNLPSFNAKTGYQGMLEESGYIWQFGGKKLVEFSFTEKNSKMDGISISTIYSGNPGEYSWQRVDPEPYRKSLSRVLKKARTTFSEAAANKQSNLVIVQPDSDVGLDSSDEMAEVLYGDVQTVVYRGLDGNEIQKNIRGPNGILRNYRNITGVIFVPSSVYFMTKIFTGSYFLSEHHLNEICVHPKLFDEMTYYFLSGRKSN